MKKAITAKQMVHFLNVLLKKDPEAVTKLFLTQSTCNEELCKTKTFLLPPKRGCKNRRVRMIGVLNGLFATNHTDPATISMITDETDSVIFGFTVLEEKDIKQGHGKRNAPSKKFSRCRKRELSEYMLAI